MTHSSFFPLGYIIQKKTEATPQEMQEKKNPHDTGYLLFPIGKGHRDQDA